MDIDTRGRSVHLRMAFIDSAGRDIGNESAETCYILNKNVTDAEVNRTVGSWVLKQLWSRTAIPSNQGPRVLSVVIRVNDDTTIPIPIKSAIEMARKVCPPEHKDQLSRRLRTHGLGGALG